jgi:hypothetical protein
VACLVVDLVLVEPAMAVMAEAAGSCCQALGQLRLGPYQRYLGITQGRISGIEGIYGVSAGSNPPPSQSCGVHVIPCNKLSDRVHSISTI